MLGFPSVALAQEAPTPPANPAQEKPPAADTKPPAADTKPPAAVENDEQKPEATPSETDPKEDTESAALVDCQSAQEKCQLESKDKLAALQKEVQALKKQLEETEAKRNAEVMPWIREGDTQFDWMKMKSGEWLKGDFKKMRDDDYEFDSDEFGLQTVDWADVEEFHSPHDMRYVMLDQVVHIGKADLNDDGSVTIQLQKGGSITIERAQLLSVVPDNHTEWSKWGLRVNLGATGRYGNTDSIDYTAMARLSRRDEFTYTFLQYDGTYGFVNDAVNANKHLGSSQVKVFISKRFYLIPVIAEAKYDEFQNIKVRWITAAGAGIHLIARGPVTLDFDLGLGYQQSRYLQVPTGGNSQDDGFLVRPGLLFEWDITDDIDFDITWSSGLVATDMAQSYHHGTADLAMEITDILDLNLGAIYDRLEQPAPLDDGSVPLKDDLILTLGLGLDLE
ncbi:MAG: DUF481 domain-containing protein [Polyangiaceae bacterium]|nr:DUF481 domain-containing protein [Polyangiaceae bacterium]